MTDEAESNALGVALVGASAGSGKTYRLTQEVTRRIHPESPDVIDLSGLIAVTYTTKAQLELESRLRRALHEQGQLERAHELPLAYIGTVHAVCLRLLKEFALELGISPDVDGLPQEEARRLLQEALESELTPALQARLHEFSSALQVNWDGRTGRHDWISRVDEIMTLARNNRVRPEELPAMAQRSLGGLFELLGPASTDGAALEKALTSALDDALCELQNADDHTKKTSEVVKKLRHWQRKLKHERLAWSEWNALARLEPAKASLPLVADLQRVASEYERHPSFRADLRGLCEAVFEAASVGLDAYARVKERRGLVDYIDMIDRALSALEVPAIEREIRERLQLLVVDEFQDTSPVQLALFSRLHTLGGRSVWVGDQKQCIFEYAGADPGLMDSVSTWVRERGGATETLERNYRSRPELVEAVSDIFVASFARHGQQADVIRTTAAREQHPGQASLPAFGLWSLLNTRVGGEHEALADGVLRLLAAPEETRVVDRATRELRDLRPSDVAVLVASNREAERLAGALSKRGISSALPRTGLMRTPEGTLLDAALRFLIDRRDTLAIAELEALLGFGGQPHGVWLTTRIRQRQQASADTREHPQASADTREHPQASADTREHPQVSADTREHPQVSASEEPAGVLRRLSQLRPQVAALSPTEIVDRVLSVLDMPTLARRWPDAHQRMGNLEALRALTRAYEERSTYLRESASLAGLTRYFDETQVEIRRLDEERASDEQHVGCSNEAVNISTYHKAKGLEWPVVVLSSLGRERRRDAFDITPETERRSFDPRDPLGGRWIRYWPWPLGQQKQAALRERAAASSVGRRIGERDGRERVRLLYVGFSRARDHLILALACDKQGKPRVNWLDELADASGPLLVLPDSSEPNPSLRLRSDVSSKGFAARVWSLSGPDAETGQVAAGFSGRGPREQPRESASRSWFSYDAVGDSEPNRSEPNRSEPNRSEPNRSEPNRSELAPYVIEPSRVTDGVPPAVVVDQVRFAQRIPFERPTSHSWDEVGSCLHAFLAADGEALGAPGRLELARRLLRAVELDGAFSPEALISASDALRSYIQERWPAATWRREIPVQANVQSPHGVRRIRGTIDLLLQCPDGVVVVDHKSFPGRFEHWSTKALEYAPQLFTYAQALSAAGLTVKGMCVHFMIGGGWVELAQSGDGASR